MKGHLEIYLAYARSSESEDETDEVQGECSGSRQSDSDWEIVANNTQALETPLTVRYYCNCSDSFRV